MSGALDLARELGLSTEELANRVVDRCVERVLTAVGYDEDGEAESAPSAFATRLKAAVLKRIDSAIDDIASRHVLPNVTTYLENLCLQETTKWGEKTGKALTFLEYLVSRAENYMTEKVDRDGKGKAEGGYNWSGSETRIANLIDRHLSFYIQQAMEKVVKQGNEILVEGLATTCKAKLEEIAKSLKVGVLTR